MTKLNHGTVPSRLPEDPRTGLGFAILEWLLWPERVVTRKVHLNITRARDKDFGFTSEAFCERLRAKHRDMKADDVDAVCCALADRCDALQKSGQAILPWLYRQCLTERSLDIEFFGAAPTIRYPVGAVMNWLALVDRVDPDGLACLALAERSNSTGLAREAEALVADWPPIFGSGDRDLARISKQGLTDLHIHFTSLWPVSLSWQRVLRYSEDKSEGIRLGHLRAMKGSTLTSVQKGCIENAAGGAPGGRCRMPHLQAVRPPSVKFFSPAPIRPQSISSVLAPERIMLFRAWRSLVWADGFDAIDDGSGATNVAELEAELDEYLVGKSLFRSQHVQPLYDTSKGLIAFDEIRRNNSHAGAFDRDEAKGGSFSGSRFVRNKGFLVRALQNTRALRGAEVRIAPPSVATTHMAYAYGKTMLASDELFQDMQLDRADLDIRVALHFKRAIGSKPARLKRDERAGRPVTMGLLRKLIEFDRDTACFHDCRLRGAHAARTAPAGHRSLRDAAAIERFSRIDLASPERGAGPWTIAPYVRLLRGDPEAFRQLGHPESACYFPKWSVLSRQGRAQLPLGSPAVRVTCHAGEDFYTLVDGLRHIDAAIVDWRMTQGDALGHCLALGLSPARYMAELKPVSIPAGVELDSLVWLRRVMITHGLGQAAIRQELGDAILGLAREIYGSIDRAHRGDDMLFMLDRKLEQSSRPILVPAGFAPNHLPTSRARTRAVARDDYAVELHLHDHFDVEIAIRRNNRRAVSGVHLRLADVIVDVQKWLTAKIRSCGVVIETNPSSNLRMERISTPAELPILSVILGSTPPPAVTICTDNPGTYDTNVEAEYALLHAALHELTGDEAALAHLEGMRNAGHCLFGEFPEVRRARSSNESVAGRAQGAPTSSHEGTRRRP